MLCCTVEFIASKLLHTLAMEFLWKLRSMLDKSKSSRPNMSKKELKTEKSMILN
jgi:hypothetical protein